MVLKRRTPPSAVRVPLRRVPVIPAPDALETGVDSYFSALGTFGTGEGSSYSAPGTHGTGINSAGSILGTGEDSVLSAPRTLATGYPFSFLFVRFSGNILALLSRSRPVVTQIRGHSGPSSPLPTTVACLHFTPKIIQLFLPLSTCVELRLLTLLGALSNFFFFFFFFSRTLLLSSFWTSRSHRCRPFFPPVLAFSFYRAQGSAIPLLVDFLSSVANSRSRAFRKSICAQEKVPTNLYEYALGGIRTHETHLYQARG